MLLNYVHPQTIFIDDVGFEFGEGRLSIRSKLASSYEESNKIIDLSTSDSENIIYQRRDIYKNVYSSENYFFLGYTYDDYLKDVEMHYCNKIKVFDIEFDFGKSIDLIAKQLSKYSDKKIKKDGEYFFEDLKIVILNKRLMGGEGNSLGYFYCSNDISHLK